MSEPGSALVASQSTQQDDDAASRRTVLRGLGIAGAALPLLAACGSSEGSGEAAGSGDGGTSSGGSSPSGGAAGGSVLARTSDIPVGGGKIFAQQELVVTQPTQGQFKAFSAVCTHQGCLVNKVAGEEIDCPCHGSRFSIKDGSVLGGPASAPLPSKKIKVQGGKIVRG